jgi:segregation and condensation protein A
VPSPLNVQLEAYEGPLDLLLDLIRKQEIDIYDIPVARITAQYLQYLQQAAELNLELGAEFIFMAATLIQIKSRMLLPRDPELEKMDPEGDPRKELVDRLLEHQRFKDAAEMLQQKRMIEEAVWSNPQIQQFEPEAEEGGLAVGLFDLVETLQKILERARNRPRIELGREDVTVPQMIAYLRDRLANLKRGDAVSATDLFESQASRRAMICLFLAILEMVRMQAVTLAQSELFGDIAIKKHKAFDEVMAGSDALASFEQEYS